eukprot:s125_g40.t1
MDVGSHCSHWDDQPIGTCSKEDRPSWCGKNWCYVDPCGCAISEPPKVSSYFPKATYGKKPLYYSYETCGSLDTFTFDSRSACVNQDVSTPTVLPGYFEAVLEADGNPARGVLRCQQLPPPSGDDAAQLIQTVQQKLGKLAMVSPIVLAISTKVAVLDTKRGSGDKRARQTLSNFGAYLTQGDVTMLGNPQASSYSKLDHIAVRMVRISLDIPNEPIAGHDTEAKCLAIGADPDDPELRKCAWGGPEIKCLGKELLHFCQVNDQTIQDWTWWSFSRGDVQRGHMAPAVVTAAIYVLILLPNWSFSRLPAPVSQKLARTPSTSSDRWQSSQKVSMLQEPTERPLSRYLHKRDGYYNRIVPDWNLQIKTLEQQYLYRGDFALLIKEVTDEGAIVQDVTTGVYGFIPEENLGNLELLPGDTVQGGRCTYMDTTVIQSPDPTMLRMQSGIVFEWDEEFEQISPPPDVLVLENGEGFIIPSEHQDAFRMIRVLRRDIRWHDSRRLFPGQFVQFDTALPHEVPVTSPLDPEAPVALRVRGLEIRFSLEEAYEMIPQGSREAMLLEASTQAALPAEASVTEAEDEDGEDDVDEVEDVDPVDDGASLVPVSSALEPRPSAAYPVVPGRPELQAKKKVHPLLQRFAKQAPEVAEAESPSWMWEPQLEYLKEEVYAPIVPVQLRQMPAKVKRKRILVHEVAHERGDTWQEASHRKYLKLWDKMKPPGRKETEKISVRYHRVKKAYEDEQVRRQKWTLSAEQKRQRRAARANGA